MRLDLYVSKKIGVSRNRAQFFIEREKIKVNNQIISKLSYQVGDDDIVQYDINGINYVSRSAVKLKGFLEEKDIQVDGAVCIDVGASTGGFTQVLLEKNAKFVYSIDVGTNQLHDSLKNNHKIKSIENTDIRNIGANFFQEKINLMVVDVSFISLSIIIDDLLKILHDGGKAILLFKPQFEVGPTNLTKLGVPKNEKIIHYYLGQFEQLLIKKNIKIYDIKKSTLPGENGNIEYFFYLEK